MLNIYKKRVLLIFVLLILNIVNVNAEENTIIDEYAKSIGVEEAKNDVPQAAKEAAKNAGINEIDPLKPGELVNINAVGRVIFNISKLLFVKNIKLYVSLIGIILIYALFDALKSSFGSESLKKVFTVCTVSGAILIIYDAVSSCYTGATEVIEQLTLFMKGMIPVMASATIFSGYPVSATVSQSLIFTIMEIMAQFNATIFMPLVTVYFALLIAGSISQNISLRGVTDLAKNLFMWGSGLLLTVFLGVMSLQTVLSSSADSVTRRSVKYAMGSFIPVLGGLLSESVDMVLSCAISVKSIVGVFGIGIIVFTVITPVIGIIINMFFVNITCGVSDILGAEGITTFLRGVQSVLGMLLTLILTLSVMSILVFVIFINVGKG